MTDWAEVYAATYQDVVKFLYRKVWDEERARDLAQEVFVRILRQDAQNPRALVFTVAMNLARDEARSAVRRKKHLTLLRSEAEVSRTTQPVDHTERNEQAAAVRRALESLNERDRDVLLLWDAGLNYEQIAEQMSLAVGAVGTTLARARKKLVAAHNAAEGTSHVARG
jgi:RNA polymerase sigma-70 factor (ECF subfamily)